MSNGYTFGMIAFLLFFLLSRVIGAQATKRLEADVRHRIYDEFGSQNNVRTFITVSMLICYFVAISYFHFYFLTISIAFLTLFLVYLIVNLFVTNKRLNSIGAPTDYVHSIMISWALYMGGFLIMILASFLL